MTTRFVILFFILNFLLAVFHLDIWQNGNTTSRAMAVLAFAESRTLQTDKYQEKMVDKIFVNGHYYSDKAPLPVFLVIPFFELVRYLGIQPQNFERTAYLIGDILCGTLPFTLIVLLTFLFIRQQNILILSDFAKRIDISNPDGYYGRSCNPIQYRDNSTISPVLLSMLPFFASFIFIYSGTFYAHPVSALFLLIAYIFLRFQKKYLLSGLFCGLSFACEFTTALVFSIWALQILYNERTFKPVLKFFIGLLPSLIFTAFYNYGLTGNFFITSYQYLGLEQQHTPYRFLEAIWGLILGVKRGIFFYAPFLFLVLYYFIKTLTAKSIKTTGLLFCGNYLLVISLCSVLAVSSFFSWQGGWCYGPRLILFIAVLLSFEGILFFSKREFYLPMFWLLILFGFVSAFLAKATIVYSVPTEIENPLKEQVLPNFLNENFNSNNLLTMIFDVSPKAANYIWLGAFIIISVVLTLLYKKERINYVRQNVA